MHVVPINDLIDHDTSSDDCVCGPELEMAGHGWVVIHHSLDGREFAEGGKE